MAMIEVRHLCKTFAPHAARGHQAVHALQNVSFAVQEREFYVLLGPSGSGKTTTLRAIAGLEEPDKGEIVIDGRLVFSPAKGLIVPPEERPIAMVFQSYALWPHLNVYDNVAFPLRHGIRRVPNTEVKRRVDNILDLLQLVPQARRAISTLSGGQQQRVALARALALEPAVLLMDEPLSNLDARLRAELRLELKKLTQSLGITTVYVTHDQVEAMMMGDRLAVMHQGRLLQEGTPWEVYQQPDHLFVARFLGEMNLLEGVVETLDGDRVVVATAVGQLTARARGSLVAGDRGTVVVRHENVGIVQQMSQNSIRAVISGRHFLGESVLYEATVAGALVRFKRPPTDPLTLGSEVLLQFPPEHTIVFPEAESLSSTSAALRTESQPSPGEVFSA